MAMVLWITPEILHIEGQDYSLIRCFRVDNTVQLFDALQCRREAKVLHLQEEVLHAGQRRLNRYVLNLSKEYEHGPSKCPLEMELSWSKRAWPSSPANCNRAPEFGNSLSHPTLQNSNTSSSVARRPSPRSAELFDSCLRNHPAFATATTQI